MAGQSRTPAHLITERTSSRRALDRHDGSSNHSEVGLRRQQSIRFTGPQARSRRELEPRMSDAETSTSFTYERLSATGKSDSRRTDSTFSDTYKVLQESQLQQRNIPSSKRHYTSESHGSSVHPPRGKLRKSKSMFAPSDFPQISHGHGVMSEHSRAAVPHSSYEALDKENKPSPNSATSALRAPKSMSFLRNRRENPSSQGSVYIDSELMMPFSKYMSPDPLQSRPRISSRPSLFFRSKTKRSESTMALRKSMRDCSNNTGLSSAFSGDSLYVPKNGSSLRSTARKVSKSFKNKIKGLFGRKSSEIGSLDQDISPQETENESICQTDMPMVREEASMSRGPSRLASLHPVPPCQQPRSRQGSLEQTEPDHSLVNEDKSRVTSWTDSVTETIGSQPRAADWDRQRLSVITENGMHGPSPQKDGQEAFSANSRLVVDSQRIYSALMKRASEATAEEAGGRLSSLDEFRSSGKPPLRTSSVDQAVSAKWSPPTIRCVQEEDDVFQDSKEGVQGDPPGEKGQPEQQGAIDDSLSSRVISGAKSSTSSRQDSDRVKPMSNRNSVFFASPSNHLFRTTSPFRRVLQENMRSSQENERVQSPETEPRYMGSLSSIMLPSRRPSTTASERNELGPYAESVYSSTTDDKPEIKKTLPLVERFPDPPRTHVREETVIDDSPDDLDDWTNHRVASNASSVEWKKVLSAKASGQEGRDTLRRVDTKIPSVPGHRREATEIDSPMEGIQEPDHNKTPSHIVQLQKTSSSTQSHSSRHAISLSPSRKDHQSEFPFPRDLAKLPPPPVPWKKDLHPAPSLPYIKGSEAKGEMWGYGEAMPLSASMGTVNSPESPKRDEAMRKRRARAHAARESPSTKSSPGLTAAVEKQFGKPGSRGQRSNWNRMEGSPSPSTIWARPGLHEKMTSENRLSGSDLSPGSLGSKQMVDTFLNSRKRGMLGSRLSTEGDSESSPGAFI